MVRIEDPQNYKFLYFRKSHTKKKKYDAILVNKKTGRTKTVPFGAKGYQHFKDSTGLGHYSNLNHGDRDRRRRYRARHRATAKHKFSSSWFSYYYLW